MITEEEYIRYFEILASRHKLVKHGQDGRKSFFYIDNGDDLEEFDEALRNKVQSPLILLVGDDGQFDDAGSENHTQTLEGQFYVLARKSNNKTLMQVRQECLPIALDFLVKMKNDAKRKLIVPGKYIHFYINQIPYAKVGPINLEWYGYVMGFRMVSAMGAVVDEERWSN